jgi:3-hydroxyacyl-[acyl-carrier-protein] dehydratase
MHDVPTSADITLIQKCIPHRYPMLLIDRVVDMVAGKSAVGIKNVTFNEPHFQGHFPAAPVMPGVLIVEAMAQTASVVTALSLNLVDSGALVYFMNIEKAKFRRKVVPGDVLELHVSTLRAGSKVLKFSGRALVDGQLAAEAEFTAMIDMPTGA